MGLLISKCPVTLFSLTTLAGRWSWASTVLIPQTSMGLASNTPQKRSPGTVRHERRLRLSFRRSEAHLGRVSAIPILFRLQYGAATQKNGSVGRSHEPGRETAEDALREALESP
ncbi:hypothetical protein CH63R_12375 [Colletotrichum higginsianum IMI 349063]|uniref:Uncharacterized protein n=1 Tax=Colletotrichum higginsianum (strain IMI 349063) TaxID=759273 RepID=A0A1B7XU27_COLHI|nr:hypothetical protein CH63R_12375 [Colletotrichum higginsianum IMI 349063]OBR03248.1 hypothetical protein CH63R_12375 [Colletotrichum higginsianum IMI 349063]